MSGRAMGLACLMGMAISAALVGCAVEPAEPAEGCSSQLHPGAVVAQERFGDGVVSFVGVENAIGVQDGNDFSGEEIEVLRFRDDSGCAAEPVDTYHYEGGEPTLEASFTHTVQGEPNLFAIVSWPLTHVGLGMNGRLYYVYAYHEADGALSANDVVVHHQELRSGVEGTVEGESSTFEGKTEQGVVAMLERLGLE